MGNCFSINASQIAPASSTNGAPQPLNQRQIDQIKHHCRSRNLRFSRELQRLKKSWKSIDKHAAKVKQFINKASTYYNSISHVPTIKQNQDFQGIKQTIVEAQNYLAQKYSVEGRDNTRAYYYYEQAGNITKCRNIEYQYIIEQWQNIREKRYGYNRYSSTKKWLTTSQKKNIVDETLQLISECTQFCEASKQNETFNEDSDHKSARSIKVQCLHSIVENFDTDKVLEDISKFYFQLVDTYMENGNLKKATTFLDKAFSKIIHQLEMQKKTNPYKPYNLDKISELKKIITLSDKWLKLPMFQTEKTAALAKKLNQIKTVGLKTLLEQLVKKGMYDETEVAYFKTIGGPELVEANKLMVLNYKYELTIEVKVRSFFFGGKWLDRTKEVRNKEKLDKFIEEAKARMEELKPKANEEASDDYIATKELVIKGIMVKAEMCTPVFSGSHAGSFRAIQYEQPLQILAEAIALGSEKAQSQAQYLKKQLGVEETLVTSDRAKTALLKQGNQAKTDEDIANFLVKFDQEFELIKGLFDYEVPKFIELLSNSKFVTCGAENRCAYVKQMTKFFSGEALLHIVFDKHALFISRVMNCAASLFETLETSDKKTIIINFFEHLLSKLVQQYLNKEFFFNTPRAIFNLSKSEAGKRVLSHPPIKSKLFQLLDICSTPETFLKILFNLNLSSEEREHANLVKQQISIERNIDTRNRLQKQKELTKKLAELREANKAYEAERQHKLQKQRELEEKQEADAKRAAKEKQQQKQKEEQRIRAQEIARKDANNRRREQERREAFHATNGYSPEHFEWLESITESKSRW